MKNPATPETAGPSGRKRHSLRVSLPNESPAMPLHRDGIVHRTKPPFAKMKSPMLADATQHAYIDERKPLPGNC